MTKQDIEKLADDIKNFYYTEACGTTEEEIAHYAKADIIGLYYFEDMIDEKELIWALEYTGCQYDVKEINIKKHIIWRD